LPKPIDIPIRRPVACLIVLAQSLGDQDLHRTCAVLSLPQGRKRPEDFRQINEAHYAKYGGGGGGRDRDRDRGRDYRDRRDDRDRRRSRYALAQPVELLDRFMTNSLTGRAHK
jgi:hypothetical protein